MIFRRRNLSRGPVLIVAGGLCLAFLNAVGTVLATCSSYDVALREWDNRLTSASRMLSAHASQSIGAADLVVRSIAENISEYRVRDDVDMRWILALYGAEILHENVKGLPQIESITIASRDGDVISVAGARPASSANLLDQPYFRAHLADPALKVHLATPVKNSNGDGETFYLSRKIFSNSGTMMGLVVAGLRTGYFSKFYGSIGLDVDRVSLMRSDGALLSHFWAGAPVQGGRAESEAIVRKVVQNEQGSLLLSDDAGANRRFTEMAAFHSGEGLPISISVAASREKMLREWKSEAAKFIVEGGAMTGLLIGATLILARLIQELEAARNAALGAVEAKSRFASNVSHELRTPMNAIIGGAHQLMQTNLAPQSREFANVVSSAAQQLMVFINDILDFSYYEARNFRVEPAPFEVRAMAERVIRMVSALATQSSLELTWNISERTPVMLIGDAGRISQILLNLLSNALKYTDRGIVALEIDYEDERLLARVTDTGRGISSSEAKRIFQPFERGSSAAAMPGTGLGLTICNKLVKAMGGEITLNSSIGWGSEFTIRLPLADAGDPANQNQASIAAATPRQLNVLVAEDVAPNRLLLMVLLQKMGHRVVAVENGREAVAKAREAKFDLVLMDLQMPELDGFAATRRIREIEGPGRAAHIIAVSANADLDGPDELSKAGFDDTLLKPVTPARLEFMIAKIAVA